VSADDNDGTGCILASSHLGSIYGVVWLQETLPDAVEDELDGQGREDNAEDAGEDVRSGLSPKTRMMREARSREARTSSKTTRSTAMTAATVRKSALSV